MSIDQPTTTYGVKEAAEYLALPEGAVYKAVSEGRLAGEKQTIQGRPRWRFTQESLDAFLWGKEPAVQAAATTPPLHTEAAPEIAEHHEAPHVQPSTTDEAMRYFQSLVVSAAHSQRATRLIEHLKGIREQIDAAIAEFEADSED